ncbi:FAD-binding oxidoreductase, partial [bacterium]|nr:FAD-binding oxidoreductase [bacterium]
MATRSLTIVDVDEKKTPAKKAVTKSALKKTPVLKKQTTTKSSMPSNAEIMASIAATKSTAKLSKKLKGKSAVEIVGSAETTPVTILTIPVPKKVTAKKATAKKSTKKVPAKKASAKVAHSDEHTGHDHTDHDHDSYPAIVPRSAELQAIKRHPLGHLLLEKKLREAGFRGGISSDKKFLEKYSTDESIFHIRPQVVLQPKSKHDVEIATKLIAVETKRFTSLSLTPRAAGTGLSGGSLTDSIVIDVCPHMHKIGEVKETKDGATITCEPGAFWRDVEKKLKKHNCYIPSYTSSKDICTIGGAVANNAAGPDSLRYGHCADWVESMDVVLADGNEYTIQALTLKEFKALSKEKHLYAKIAREIFTLIEKNEKVLRDGHPKTPKGNAGYALWKVFSDGVENFKKGKGTFDLTRLISGSQGTVGIITHLTIKAIPIQQNTTLITVPIFDLQESTKVIIEALKFNPINIEIFDALTFDLALKNPNFFKARLSGLDYY